MPNTRKKRSWVLLGFLGYLLIAIAGFFPLIVSLLTIGVCNVLGIDFTEAGPPDIPVIGNLLYTCAFAFWLTYATLPLAILAGIAWSLVVLAKLAQAFWARVTRRPSCELQQ